MCRAVVSMLSLAEKARVDVDADRQKAQEKIIRLNNVLAAKDAVIARVITKKDQAVAELIEKDKTLAEKDHALAEKDHALAEKDYALAEKDQEIARLRAAAATLLPS